MFRSRHTFKHPFRSIISALDPSFPKLYSVCVSHLAASMCLNLSLSSSQIGFFISLILKHFRTLPNRVFAQLYQSKSFIHSFAKQGGCGPAIVNLAVAQISVCALLQRSNLAMSEATNSQLSMNFAARRSQLTRFSCSPSWTTMAPEFLWRDYARRSSGTFLGWRKIGLAGSHPKRRRGDPSSLQSAQGRGRKNASCEGRSHCERRRLRSRCRGRKHSPLVAQALLPVRILRRESWSSVATRRVAQAILPVRFSDPLLCSAPAVLAVPFAVRIASATRQIGHPFLEC